MAKVSCVPFVPLDLSHGQNKWWTVTEADSCIPKGRGDVDLIGCFSAPAALREIDREMQPSAVDRSEAVPIFWLKWGVPGGHFLSSLGLFSIIRNERHGQFWWMLSSWIHWRMLYRGGGIRHHDNSASGETIKGIQFNHQASFWDPW